MIFFRNRLIVEWSGTASVSVRSANRRNDQPVLERLLHADVGGVVPLLEDDDLDHRDRAIGGAAFGGCVDIVEDGCDFGPVDEAVDAVEPVVAACVGRDENIDEG